jgi:hypothetical protein
MKYIPYVLIVAIALIVFTGFVVDEGGQIQTRQQALAIAQGAARSGTNAAGAEAIDGDAFQLSGQTAVDAADRYIQAAGGEVSGSATLSGGKIVVTVHAVYRTRLSFLVGIDHVTVTGAAAARLIDG